MRESTTPPTVRSALPWRNTIVAAVLALWLGGLAFYASVVVPLGADALGGHEAFGFVTRRVTVGLNHMASGVLAVLVLHHLVPGSARPTRMQWITTAILVACQLALYLLHPWLDELLDVAGTQVRDREVFYGRHRIYLLTTTVQWCAGAIQFRCLVRQ